MSAAPQQLKRTSIAGVQPILEDRDYLKKSLLKALGSVVFPDDFKMEAAWG